MRLHWTQRGWDDYMEWQEAGDVKNLKRVNGLINETRRNPFVGIGKPEPLKNELSGWWSRRITQEHRLVYRVEGKGGEQALVIASCRWHY